MPPPVGITARVSGTVNIGGIPFPFSQAYVHPDIRGQIVSVPVAVPGVLTTRTSNTAGIITTSIANPITGTPRVDIYWGPAGGPSQGAAHGGTVTSITGNAITFDALAGEVLPAATTIVQITVPVEVAFPIIGNNIQAIAASLQAGVGIMGTVDLQDVTPADCFNSSIFPDGVLYLDGGVAWYWAAPNNEPGTNAGADWPNPLHGTTPLVAYLSHNDINLAHTMSLAALLMV